MGNTLDRVKQTHKAILFENFNSWQSNTLNLATVLTGTYNDISEKEEYIKRLEVHSFKEFVDKFAPKIFERVTRIGDAIKFEYTLEEGKFDNAKPMKFTDHAYYKMLSSMYINKENSGKSNRDFNSKDVLEIMTPQNEIKEAKDLRDELYLLSMQFTEAQINNENTNVYAQRLLDIRGDLEQKAAGSSLSKITLRLADLKNQILLLTEKQDDYAESQSGDTNNKLETGYLDFDENGNFVIRELASGEFNDSNDPQQQLQLQSKENLKLLKSAVDEDLDSNEEISGFTRELVVNTYLPTVAKENSEFPLTLEGINEKKAQLEVIRDNFESIYIQAQESFMEALKQVATKIIGVKIFFDHATINGADDGELPPNQGLLITNCSVNDLMLKENKRIAFEKFIEDHGKNQVREEKFWIGILPHVLIGRDNPDEQGNSVTIDPFARRQAQDDTKTKKIIDVTKLSAAKQLLAMMEKARILTVFNPVVAKDSPFTFGKINASAVKNIKNLLTEKEGINYRHAVFAYPNFTLVNDTLKPVDEREGSPNINISAIYVDAAYVAAGLLVATQQPKFLVKNGFSGRVDPNNACVRIDLEEDEMQNNILTHFNQELSLSWSKDIMDSILDDHFGFVFSGDSKFDRESNKYLNKSYVISARTLHKYNGVYQPIYKTLTNDFILSYLQPENKGGRSSKTLFKNFLNKDVIDWENDAKRGESKRIINTILRKDEHITRSEKGSNFLKVVLSDGEELIEVQIDDN